MPQNSQEQMYMGTMKKNNYIYKDSVYMVKTDSGLGQRWVWDYYVGK